MLRVFSFVLLKKKIGSGWASSRRTRKKLVGLESQFSLHAKIANTEKFPRKKKKLRGCVCVQFNQVYNQNFLCKKKIAWKKQNPVLSPLGGRKEGTYKKKKEERTQKTMAQTILIFFLF